MFSARCANLSSFKVMDVLEKAQELERAGRDIIHLQIGEPDFPTPDCIKKAACKAIQDGKTQYTHSQGIIELREAICANYAQKYGVSVQPQQVFVTPGTSPAMLLAFSALLEQGDSLILSDPCYACYPNFVCYAGADCKRVPVYEQDGFQYRVAEIEKRLDEQSKGILINSPANPTGSLLSEDRLQRICDLGLTVFSDEIYHGLVYEGKEHSALEYTQDCIVFNGFSKLYAMTGWRLGYMIVPKGLVPTMQKIQQNFLICTSAVAQWAGLAALTQADQEVERMRETFNERRLFLLEGLEKLGLKAQVPPTGAFYVLVNAAHLDGDSMRLAFDILEKAGVGVTPGVDFGPHAEGYLRFSYANSLENIEEGLRRLGKYIENKD